MHSSVALLLVLGFGRVFVFASLCPPRWHRFGESCYLIETQRMTWHEAGQSCEGAEASLAVPNSAEEHKFLWESFLRAFDSYPSFGLWIGCNDIAEEGKWEKCPLKGGNHSGFENWKSGQPKNVVGADCGILSTRHDGQWADQDCSLDRYSACEYPIPLSTSPATFCLTTDATGRMPSRCLMGHVLTQIPTTGVVSCGQACRHNPHCRSFNVLMYSPGNGECQLNNATRLDVGEQNMHQITNCYFFEL